MSYSRHRKCLRKHVYFTRVLGFRGFRFKDVVSNAGGRLCASAVACKCGSNAGLCRVSCSTGPMYHDSARDRGSSRRQKKMRRRAVAFLTIFRNTDSSDVNCGVLLRDVGSSCIRILGQCGSMIRRGKMGRGRGEGGRTSIVSSSAPRTKGKKMEKGAPQCAVTVL